MDFFLWKLGSAVWKIYVREGVVRTAGEKPRSRNAASYDDYPQVRIAFDTRGCLTLPVVRIFQFYSQSWNKSLGDLSHFSSLVWGFFLVVICGSCLKFGALPTILYRRLLWGLWMKVRMYWKMYGGSVSSCWARAFIMIRPSSEGQLHLCVCW